MANFDFLNYDKDYSSFAKLAQDAEFQYNRNTVFSSFAARKCLEQAVKWMYSVDGDLRRPYSDSIQVLVHEASFIAAVPSNIRRNMQDVIQIGNDGVHGSEVVAKARSLLALKSLFNVLNWLDYTYGSKYEPRVFDEAAIPQNKVTIKIAKPNREELQKYKEQLEEKEKTIAELTKLLAEAQAAIQTRKENPEQKPALRLEDLSEFETRRQFIDEDLKLLGWKLDKVQVCPEFPVDDMEGIPGKSGFIDYALFGKDGKPLAVIEAKRTSKDPNVGKQQAVLYADCMERKFGRRPFIFYTNGFETFFWDDTQYAPRNVSMIFSMDDLQKLMDRRAIREDSNSVKINTEISGRPYQMKAVRAVCSELEKKARKFLLVMATGTGKTRTAISLVDVLSRAHAVSNVLFLADRIQLVEQAYDAFRDCSPETTVCNLLDPKDKAQNKGARVVFSTYPTILNAIETEKNKDGNRIFTPAHFDLIIVDEAHRSIFKKYRAIFEYFDSFLVGLTATPRRDVDKSTFEFFELADDVPTDVYEYETAVGAGYLVPYHAIEKTSTFLDEGINLETLSENDLEKIRQAEEDGEEAFEEIPPQAINDYVFNKDTTRLVLKDLMEKGIKVEGGDKLGKTIIFAYNKQHAQHIVDTFDETWKQYAGKMCRRIVCDDAKVKSTIKDFKRSDSGLQIAVSVDMLDTGVDIPEVVNLVFYKKIRSKIKFWQMIGRGTRLAPDLVCTDESGNYIGKKYFYIFDYLRNFEYFREEKNGIEGGASKSLTERIFNHKCRVIQLLQNAEWAEQKFADYRKQLVEEVHAQIKVLDESLRRGSPAARLAMEHIVKFREIKSFECLSDGDLQDLERHVAPLVFYEEFDQYAKGFDNFCYGIMEAALASEPISFFKGKIKNVAERLLRKTSINAVRAHLAVLQRLVDDSYYEDKTVLDFEEIRKEIRSLAQFAADKSYMENIFVDYEDKVSETEAPYGRENPSPIDSFDEYKKKVDSYLAQHMNDEAIHKLRTNQKLSQKDFDSLNRIFKEELGTESLFNKLAEGRSLGVFIRHATKMERSALNEYFAEFINDANMNNMQIEFVQRLIDIIVEQGEVNMEALMKGRPPFDRPRVFMIFGNDDQNKIFELLKTINQNAKTSA